ncbi:hypothetical protein HDU96_004511, partial [Phlyctochytrium bullatum]
MHPLTLSQAPLDGKPRPSLDSLSVEVLRTILLDVHPNDLPKLAAVNRYLRHTIPAAVDHELAEHHLAAIDLKGLRIDELHYNRPLLLEHAVAAMRRYGYRASWTSQTFYWPWPHDCNGRENLRLHRAEVMRAVVQKGYWPSPKFDEYLNGLEFADNTAQLARPYRRFIFESALVGFTEGLALIPANHPILSEREHYEGYQKLMSLAARSNSLESVKLLHELGAPINEDVLESPLHCAITARGHFGNRPNVEMMQFLLDHGADTEARYRSDKDAPTCTALLTTSKNWIANGHVEALKLVVAFGADVEARDEKGCTALMYEVSYGHVECVQALLDAGADINATDWEGKTALGHNCASYGDRHREVVKMLKD